MTTVSSLVWLTFLSEPMCEVLCSHLDIVNLNLSLKVLPHPREVLSWLDTPLQSLAFYFFLSI